MIDNLLGINIGTSKIVAVSMRSDIGSRSVEHQLNGQSAEFWLLAMEQACRTLQIQGNSPVVAISGTSGSYLLLDKNGYPIGCPVMYNESCEEHLPEVKERCGGLVDLHPDLFTIDSPIVKLYARWKTLKFVDRERVRWLCPQSVWLTYMLVHDVSSPITGLKADITNCRKLGGNSSSFKWPLDIYDALGLPSYILPEIVSSGTEVGRGLDRWSAIGLVDALVLQGMTDGNADAMALVGDKVGEIGLVGGSTTSLKGLLREYKTVPADAYVTPSLIDSEKYLYNAWISSGENLRCLAHRESGSVSDLSKSAWSIDKNSRIPPLLPLRTIIVDDKLEINAIMLARALMEAVSYWEAYHINSFEKLSITSTERVHFVGGTADSHEWMQHRANAYGKTVNVYSAGAAIGTLLPGLLKNGIIGNIDDFLSEFRIPAQVYYPQVLDIESERRLAEVWAMISEGL